MSKLHLRESSIIDVSLGSTHRKIRKLQHDGLVSVEKMKLKAREERSNSIGVL
ncbi:MAG TPA: hypothetical protein VE573_18335 [Nitrososphaeraceae archaeon]|nr:hypothetical protein [Nitrososphaeraceae archaeon]